MDHNSLKIIQDYNAMVFSGHGEVSVVPDIAIVRLGVQTTGENLQAIQAENAQISQVILEALRQLGVTEIKTIHYDINKLYDYVDGRQLDRGYSVQNILEIRTNNLDLTGAIIDTAVEKGSNVVELIRFEVSDTDLFYLQALNMAVANAFGKAVSVAENLGIQFSPYPRRITENSTPPIPFRTINMREDAFTTPIEAGTNQIEASVTVEFTY
jgi:uncharacterized protein